MRLRGFSPWPLARQNAAFSGIRLVSTLLHHAGLAALGDAAAPDPVPATLAGYVAGGIVSYALNRSVTYASLRPHREATWRFAMVAFVGFCITWAVMGVFVRRLGAPYLPAQVVTTGLVLFWSFLAHKLWTFRH